MYYDYDAYWAEPSEFDQQVEEFKDTLRNSVKDEIKEKIAFLEKELEEVKEFRDEKKKFIQEYESKINEMKNKVDSVKRDVKESEEKWKKARLYQLLGDYLTVGWKIGYAFEYGEKCDKCDKDRRIHFTSPQGREYTEECQCAKGHYKYFPKEATLSKFYVRKKNFPWSDDGKVDYYNRCYTVTDCDDFDRYESTECVYTHSDDIDYMKVNAYYDVFLNEEDCQKFCDWKNKQELKKINN